jgi:hypothetical protein
MYHDQLTASAAVVFGELPVDQGVAEISKFARHSAISFAGVLTHAGYTNIPVSWLLCENDSCIPLEVQKSEIAMIEAARGSKVDVTNSTARSC